VTCEGSWTNSGLVEGNQDNRVIILPHGGEYLPSEWRAEAVNQKTCVMSEVNLVECTRCSERQWHVIEMDRSVTKEFDLNSQLREKAPAQLQHFNLLIFHVTRA